MGFDMNAFSLAGKKAIVTGGAKKTGLCYGMAVALHDAGAESVILDANSQVENTVAELGGAKSGYHAVVANLLDLNDLSNGFQQAISALGGRLDILVNGAGLQYRCPSEEFPEDAWDRIMGVNIKGVFFMSQLAGKVMLKQGKGKIINIASTNSFIGLRNMPAYVSSKGGVKQLTMALSSEWSGRGINVNAIAPGYMDTEMSKDLQQMEQGKQLTKRIPMGRWGHPEDLMGTVVFLASSASDYISGVTLPVDGGHLAS